MTGRLLGVDYGTVRVGLAVSDPDRIVASPLMTYGRVNADDDAGFFRQLVTTERTVQFVVGLPVHTDGGESTKSKEARAYGAWLHRVTDLPVVFWDERYSTALAESAMWQAGLTHRRRKDRRDRVAAQILLQAYLDAGCPPGEGIEPI